MNRFILIFLLAMALLGFSSATALAAAPPSNPGATFPPPLESYQDGDTSNLWTVLMNRVLAEPFNLVATVIFLLAIIHTFLAPRMLHLSHRIQHDYEAGLEEIHGPDL